MSYSEFIELAEDDLDTAKYLLMVGKFRACVFHAQQSVEKYLKAYILKKENELIRTHSIRYLLEICMQHDNEFKELLDKKVHKIGKFYTLSRYAPIIEISKEEAEEAVEIAEKVREFVRERI